MSTEFHHVSVLLEECIEGLAIKPDGIYVDGTLGGAGHSSRIAASLTTGRHIGIDRDPMALKVAGERLAPWKDNVTLVHSNFCEIASVLDSLNIDGVDGILLDLGVSSPQLDDAERGFSYMVDAPLDMRMNNEDSLSAHTVVNTWSYEELKRILYDYGEERYAGLIAAAVVVRLHAARRLAVLVVRRHGLLRLVAVAIELGHGLLFGLQSPLCFLSEQRYQSRGRGQKIYRGRAYCENA